jgi:hypothetical protein
VKGTIVHKSKQVYGYADDIALIGRNLTALKELYRELHEEGLNMGLSINENKTKYMKMSPTQINIRLQNLSTEDHNFEAVREFTYLAVTINNENKIDKKINGWKSYLLLSHPTV